MVEEVKLSLPVVANLRSNTLTERHWEMLNDVLKIDVRANKGATFKQMMKVTDMRYTEPCIYPFAGKILSDHRQDGNDEVHRL